jgi:CheY-like chemotaxis protein
MADKPPPGSPQLLVVDADPDFGLIFQAALDVMGYNSTLASSVEHALRLLNERPFDLILMDTYFHSGQTPRETWASLYPLLALSHPVPVVLCAPWPVAEIDVQQEGFAGLLAQPCDVDLLVATVAEYLNLPWSPAQLGQKEVVHRLAAAFILRDARAVVALCTEEVRFYPWIVPVYPSARPAVGRADVQTYLQEAMGYLGAYQIDVLHLYPCPHGVAMRLHVHWHDASGAPQQHMLGCCVKVTPEGRISQMGLPRPDERLLALLSPPRGA